MIPIARVASLILLTAAGSPLRAQTAVPPATPAPAPTEDVLSYADLLYGKEQYALAAQQYQVFIREQPQSANLQAAWFRLGECYLKVNQVEDAVTTFNYLINTFRKGSFAGSAAYRLAVLRFNSKDYRNSLAYFKVAKDELSDPAARTQALFIMPAPSSSPGRARKRSRTSRR